MPQHAHSTTDTASETVPSGTPLHAAWPPTERFMVAPKPAGGFTFLTVGQLALVWSAYRADAITLLELRVWFAAVELCARRRRMPSDKQPHFTLEELRSLVGNVRIRRLRPALGNLEVHGLLTWTPNAITLITSPSQLHGIDLAGSTAMLEAIPYPDRKVPLPRRTLRYIAAPRRRKTQIATMLGVMIRCLFYSKGETGTWLCRSGGNCAPAWIARVFGIDLRHAKREMGRLQQCDWLMRQPNSHWVAQRRGGGKTVINLWWQPPQAAKNSGHTPPPQAPNSGHKLPPPDSNSETSSRMVHHNNSNSAEPPHTHTNPPSSAPMSAAVMLHTDATVDHTPGDTAASPTAPDLSEGHQDRKAGGSPPRPYARETSPSDAPLKDITVQDLKTYEGIERLFIAFCAQGLPHTAANLHNVLAAAHYALQKATNPPAYFRKLVDHQAWNWLREQDYEAAGRQVMTATETLPPVGSPVDQLLTARAGTLNMPSISAPPAAPQHGHAGQSEAPVVRTYRLFDTTAAQQEEQQRLIQWQQELTEEQAFEALPEAQQQELLTAAQEALTREGTQPDYCTPFQIRLRALELFAASTSAREAPPEAEADALKQTPADILAIVQPVREALGQDHAGPQQPCPPEQHRWVDASWSKTRKWCRQCNEHHPDCQCPMCAGDRTSRGEAPDG